MRVSRGRTLDRYYVGKILGVRIFVHRIHTSDERGVFHDHPWNGVTLILGRYLEERLGDIARPRSGFHRVPAHVPHRIDLLGGAVWTVFFRGPRIHRWSQFRGDGSVFAVEPWRGWRASG